MQIYDNLHIQMVEVLETKTDNIGYRPFIVFSHLVRRINMNIIPQREIHNVLWSIAEELSNETMTYYNTFLKRQFSLDTQPSF